MSRISLNAFASLEYVSNGLCMPNQLICGSVLLGFEHVRYMRNKQRCGDKRDTHLRPHYRPMKRLDSINYVLYGVVRRNVKLQNAPLCFDWYHPLWGLRGRLLRPVLGNYRLHLWGRLLRRPFGCLDRFFCMPFLRTRCPLRGRERAR